VQNNSALPGDGRQAHAQDGLARNTGAVRANKQVLQLIFTEENQSLQLKIEMLTAIRSYFDG
jgi:hypothetical protein